MSRVQASFVCTACGSRSAKWQGQCPGCGEWNSLEAASLPATGGSRGQAVTAARRLSDIQPRESDRMVSGIGELDRVLGGGFVPGSVVLLGGAPGIGKSTLLLRVAAALHPRCPALYVTGEESAEQVALRAARLGLDPDAVLVLPDTDVDAVTGSAGVTGARLVIVDSIQTMSSSAVPAAPGSPTQLRECTARLIRFAKGAGVTVILVGHVTKEGVIAGPRMLEHMVDAVLYFEDEAGSRHRVLRAVKNRFGAANELGIFVMMEDGLREVRNPSAIFLSRGNHEVAGSAVTILYQGTRPLLVEVQALTDQVGGGATPRRVAVGTDPNRLSLLLAVLHRHAGVSCHDHDVFINVVGGIRVGETAVDLAVLAAVLSSMRDRAFPGDTALFGEVGLTGEIRPVAWGEERIREAAKLGFRRVIVPAGNQPRREIQDLEVVPAGRVREALLRLGGE